jgi:hypothetical protein
MLWYFFGNRSTLAGYRGSITVMSGHGGGKYQVRNLMAIIIILSKIFFLARTLNDFYK